MVEPRPTTATADAPIEGAAEAARPRFFYGWVIMGVGFAAQFVFGISQQAFQTYLIPLGAEFGWSRTILSAPRSLTQVETAILGPINGWLVHRFGPRAIMFAGITLLGTGLLLFARVNNVLTYYLVNLMLGIGASLTGLLVISTALNNWFRRRRTLVIAIATIGFSLAGVVAVPFIRVMQETAGWRTAATMSGLVILALGYPSAWFLRARPEDMGLLPDGDLPGAASRLV